MHEDHVRALEELVATQNRWRGRECINLIASENTLSRRARALLGSDFGHRYAEGHPGERYYEGTQHIDVVETLAKEQMRKIFKCTRAEVRCVSGTNANEALFCATIDDGDIVVVNSVPAGGHISHQRMGVVGRYAKKIINYPLTEDGYRVDVGKTKDLIREQNPKVLVFGKSLFLFPEPLKELVPVCREAKIKVIYDGAHVLGLIGGCEFQDPLGDGVDALVGSTHKTFFGPQRGVILSNLPDEDWKRIDRKVFPGTHSNHHLDTLPPLLMTAYEFAEFGPVYAKQVISNAKALGRGLDKQGLEVAAKELGFTASHQVAVNVKKHGGGTRVAMLLRTNDIICNQNLLPGDTTKELANPSGIRLGTQEMTRVGMKEAEMDHIAELMKAAIVDGRSVKDEVNKFRERFQHVQYSFDNLAVPASR